MHSIVASTRLGEIKCKVDCPTLIIHRICWLPRYKHVSKQQIINFTFPLLFPGIFNNLQKLFNGVSKGGCGCWAPNMFAKCLPFCNTMQSNETSTGSAVLQTHNLKHPIKPQNNKVCFFRSVHTFLFL